MANKNERYSVGRFCRLHKVRKKDLATLFDVFKQQVSKWCTEDDMYSIEHDRANEEIHIIRERAELTIKSAKFIVTAK